VFPRPSVAGWPPIVRCFAVRMVLSMSVGQQFPLIAL
jgi:hypothetical protein